MKKSELKSYIKKCIQELLSDEDLNEINTTSNIDGYQTPHAFSGTDEDDHKKKMKSKAEVFEYKSTDNVWNEPINTV